MMIKRNSLGESANQLLKYRLDVEQPENHPQSKESQNEQAVILIVDDDYINIEIMKTMLQTKGLQSDTAYTGKDAIDLIKDRIKLALKSATPMYEIILLDYSMPEMDGPQVATQIFELVKKYKIGKPYICCCTAYAEASFQRQAYAVGMDNFLTKPIDSNALDNILTHLKK